MYNRNLLALAMLILCLFYSAAIAQEEQEISRCQSVFLWLQENDLEATMDAKMTVNEDDPVSFEHDWTLRWKADEIPNFIQYEIVRPIEVEDPNINLGYAGSICYDPVEDHMRLVAVNCFQNLDPDMPYSVLSTFHWLGHWNAEEQQIDWSLEYEIANGQLIETNIGTHMVWQLDGDILYDTIYVYKEDEQSSYKWEATTIVCPVEAADESE